MASSSVPEIINHRTTTTITTSIFKFVISHVVTLLSFLSLNPFCKLSPSDLAGETPSWTSAFIGSLSSYSFPSSKSQAQTRLHENVKRYARNYSYLFLAFFVCSLDLMPFAFAGLILSVAVWSTFKYCGNHWGLDQYPLLRQIILRIAQCATALIIICSNLQIALLGSLGVSYAVMILHASFRKLASE